MLSICNYNWHRSKRDHGKYLILKYLIYILIMEICSTSVIYPKEISLKEIYNLRTAKTKECRKLYGKQFLVKKLGSSSRPLASNIADIAARLGCNLNMQKTMRKALGKNIRQQPNLIEFACKTKQRER